MRKGNIDSAGNGSCVGYCTVIVCWSGCVSRVGKCTCKREWRKMRKGPL